VSGGRDELAPLREAFPGYRFRRRDIRGVPCYVAEGGRDAEAPLAAARTPAILADMLAAALGKSVRLRAAAVAAAYRDRGMTVKECAALFGVSRTTITKILAAEHIPLRRPGEGVDDRAVVTAYRDRRMSLHDTASRFGISQRRVTAILDQHGVRRRPAGRPPQSGVPPQPGSGSLPHDHHPATDAR
jgi:excisionase family DNA binding protein